jgi:hypothetical protein
MITLTNGYSFIVWYLVKHRENFTFTTFLHNELLQNE